MKEYNCEDCDILDYCQKDQELINRLTEVNQKLTQFIHYILNLLRQYIEVSEYEYKLRKITEGNDVVL